MGAPATPGRFCREIHVTIEPGRSVGELVDDFHHFRATIDHDGSTITRVHAEAPRIPWQTCGGAVQPLLALQGARLATSIRAASRLAASRLQCTHLYDAACIAVARTGRGVGSVVYRIEVPDRVDGRAQATLRRNGDLVFAWELDGHTIRGPEPFSGQGLIGGTFAGWAEATLDPERSEAALILARASVISFGRSLELDDRRRAVDVPGTSLGVCHTYSEAQGERSFRVVGSARRLVDADDPRRASLDPTPDEVQLFRRAR